MADVSKFSNLRGKFITFEGVEGVGKSTGIKYLSQKLEEQQVRHILTREPGGTAVGEEIRKIFLHNHEEQICDKTELLLVFASRAQHISKVILPALKRGETVLCDRFTDATYAYQGGGRGISFDDIAMLEKFVQITLKPDITFLYDAPLELALARAAKRDRPADRMEQEQIDFFARVRNSYLSLAAKEEERFCLIDSSLPLEQVQENMISCIEGIACIA